MTNAKNWTVAYHARTDENGWQEVCRYPIDSPEWPDSHKSFIQEMLFQGEWVLTCGWNMWQIVR